MKPLPEKLRDEIAARFGYAPSALTFLGGGREDSDGIVFRTEKDGHTYILKYVGINPADPTAVAKAEARAAFFAYLGQNGLQTVAPEPDENGNLIETGADGEMAVIAYKYKMLTGEHPSPEIWTDAMVQAWGHMLGTAHRLAAQYPVWEGLAPYNAEYTPLSWGAEVDSFYGWCPDADIKAYWKVLKAQLQAKPYTHETAGFIHNDPHMQNLLWEDGKIKLLDFDVAGCHFYACDLAIAIQSVLFTRGGGLDRPVENQGAIDWFTDNLLKGYVDANPPSAPKLEDIELFIRYRRALLFTVMYEWLQTKPALASWKARILDAPRVLAAL